MNSIVEASRSDLVKINFCAFSEKFQDVRTKLPYEFISNMSGVDLTYYKNEIRIGNFTGFKGPKIIIAQRAIIEDRIKWLKAISKLREADCLFIYEIDDHFDLIDRIHKRDVGIKTILKASMAVQTSTNTLSREYLNYNKNVKTFENCCHDISFFREGNKIPHIFYGALNRENYSKGIAESISGVIKKYDAFVHVVADKSFYDGIISEKKAYYNKLDYNEYLSVMSKCDILISPLKGLSGEKFKSDVKYIEASSYGLATIASDLVYSDTIKDGETGVIVYKDIDWPEKLESLLESSQYRRYIGYNAWDYVRRERMFSQQAPLRVNWYLDLWSRRDELWQMALDRLPELRKL